MKVFIFDASVILKFLLGKELSVEKKVIGILKEVKNKKISLYSTYLLPLEIGNGLRYTLKDENLADEVLEKFLALPVNYFLLKNVHYSKILKLSYNLGTSFYDTSYHFLAKLLKGTFLTSDNEYYKKAKDLGDIELLL